MRKKPILIRILAYFIHIVPVIVVTILKGGNLIKSPGASLSIIGLFALIILALIFKNALKNSLNTFGAFWFSLISVIICVVMYNIGEPLFWIAGASLAGGILSTPLHIWYSYLTRPVTEDAFLNALKELVKEKEDVDE